MAKEFIVTSIGNEIEYATTNGRGKITGERKKVTKQVMRALAAWFLATGNDNYYVDLASGGRVSVFSTTDEKKAERIFEILDEDRED